MYSRPALAFKYFNYWLQSSNGKGHGTHSPFIYRFITEVLTDKRDYEDYEKIESLRKELLSDHRVLQVNDLGAGSVISGTSSRRISAIAKNAAKPKKFGQLLFRMVNTYEPANILELGTSLGISTAYFSFANPQARIITIEGADEIAKIAKNNFRKLGLENIELLEGSFEEELPKALSDLSKIDFAFIDGNHRKEPTLRYFEGLLSFIHNDSILVFDDIHWSKEMEDSWDVIQSHPSVRGSIDLFFMGIVLFRSEFHEKQHFHIRF